MAAMWAVSGLRGALLCGGARTLTLGTPAVLRANAHFFGGGRTVFLRTSHNHESDAALRHMRWILTAEGVVAKKNRETRRFPPGQSERLKHKRRLMQFYLRYLQERTEIARHAEFRDSLLEEETALRERVLRKMLRDDPHFWERRLASSAKPPSTPPSRS